MLCSFANHSNVYSFRKEIQRDNTRICNQDISLIYDGWSIVGNQIKLFEKRNRPWQDSNLQSPDPKSGALSIRPHGLTLTVDFTNQTWHRSVSKHVAIFLREVFDSKTSFDEIKKIQTGVQTVQSLCLFTKEHHEIHNMTGPAQTLSHGLFTYPAPGQAG